MAPVRAGERIAVVVKGYPRLSETFIAQDRARMTDPRVQFRQGDAASLASWESASRDVAVAGLVLNFVPDPAAGVREMVRITRPGGVVGAAVWDYESGMTMLRVFWEAASSIWPGA